MNTSVLLRLAALITATTGLVATTHAQSEIYREVFGLTNGSTNAPLATYDWEVYTGTTATRTSTTVANSTNYGVTGEQLLSASNIAQAPNLQSGPATPLASGRAYLFGGGLFMAFTDEYTVSSASHTVTSFTWDQRDNNAALLGAVVRIGGAWFASAPATYTAGSTAWGNASVNFSTTTWRSLSFTPTITEGAVTTPGVLSIGAAAMLPEGDISAFGLYAPTERNTNAARIDGFVINATAAAVPEPSSFAAFAGAAGLGAAALRRRGPASRR